MSRLNIKHLMGLPIVTLLLTACELKVEIPTKRVGVVITNDDEVKIKC